METQVDVDKVEPHNLEDKVFAFIRNNTSGVCTNGHWEHRTRTNTGTRSWRFQPENHVELTRGERGSDSYPDLNNCEHASQWGQDWNAGHADTSGSSDDELYGLQKGKGAKGTGEVSTASATTVESQVIRPSFVVQRAGKQKERERRETAKVGQSERDGQTVKVGTLQAKVGSNRGLQE